MAGEIIPRGLDFLTTVCAQQRITIPPKLLGGGRGKPFDEMVTFVGAPLTPAHGNADTVMERLEDAVLGEPVETRLAAFLNVSAAPIRVQIGRGEPVYFDVYVTLSPTEKSPGKTVFESKDGISGTFKSEVSLSPLFELRPLGGGKSLFIDTGKTPVPGFPMRLGSAGGKWSRRPAQVNAVRSFGGTSLFYTSEVMIEAFGANRETLAACAKQQAVFIVPGAEPTRFERVNFGIPSLYTNIEIDRWT